MTMHHITVDTDRFRCGGHTDAEYEALDTDIQKAFARGAGLNRTTTFVPRCWNCGAELARQRDDPTRWWSWLETCTRKYDHKPDGPRTSVDCGCDECGETTKVEPLRHVSRVIRPTIRINDQ